MQRPSQPRTLCPAAHAPELPTCLPSLDLLPGPPRRPGPTALGSGKAGREQGAAGCDLRQGPRPTRLENRKGPWVPGCVQSPGTLPDGCFPNCSPGGQIPGAQARSVMWGNQKDLGSLEELAAGGKQATHRGPTGGRRLHFPHWPGGGGSHTYCPRAGPLPPLDSCLVPGAP